MKKPTGAAVGFSILNNPMSMKGENIFAYKKTCKDYIQKLLSDVFLTFIIIIVFDYNVNI